MTAQITWQSARLLPVIILLAGGLCVAVIWLYAPQVRRVKRPWRWVLPGLHILGLFAIAASLLQPVWRRARVASEQGTVLVLVDRSRSMAVTDVARTPAERVALADAFDQLPAGVRKTAAGRLAAEVQQLSELTSDVASAEADVEAANALNRGAEAARSRWVEAKSAFKQAAAAVVAKGQLLAAPDDVRSKLAALGTMVDSDVPARWVSDADARITAATEAMRSLQIAADTAAYDGDAAARNAADEIARQSRWSLVERAVLRKGSGLLDRLKDRSPVQVQALGIPASPLKIDSSGVVPHLPVGPDAVSSDIVGAVNAVLGGAGAGDVRAVVLFSDGRQVGGDAAIVSSLTPAGVPVFAVAVSPPGEPKDLRFAHGPSLPTRAYVGESVSVVAAVRAAGISAGRAEVQLRAGNVVQTQPVEWSQSGISTSAEFTLRLDQPGPQRVVLSIPPVPGEITAENNVAERWINVLPQPTKVAAFAGTPGWDFQLLRQSLMKSAGFQLQSSILQDGARLPIAAEELLRQDVIVLSDVSAQTPDDVQWDAINRFVRERGGSLFLIAGPSYLPSTFTSSTIVASSLLPYDAPNAGSAWRTWPGEQPAFRFSPATGLIGDAADALRLGPGAGALRYWQSLPGVFRFLPVPELSKRFKTRALLVETDSGLPALTESIAGRGRIFFVGLNETWRWRLKQGSRDFDRFWLQLFRYAAGEPYAVLKNDLSLGIDRVTAAPGQPVAVRARITRDDAADFRVQVLRGDAILQSLPLLTAGEKGDGKFATLVNGLPEGDYVIRLARPSGDPEKDRVETTLHVALNSEAESADVSGDAAVLQRIADATGGKMIPLDRVNELPAILASTGQKSSGVAEITLWDTPVLFVFVVACFGCEWGLRKRLGLA